MSPDGPPPDIDLHPVYAVRYGRVGPPLQGFPDLYSLKPRALPWAIVVRPVGPPETHPLGSRRAVSWAVSWASGDPPVGLQAGRQLGRQLDR